MSSDTSAQFDPLYKWLGIPPSEQPVNHYRLLGVVMFESDADVIAAAADRQMAHVKSFAMGRYASESQQLLNELARARVCLLNVERKAAYDQRLRGEKHRAQQDLPTSSSKADHPLAPTTGDSPPPFPPGEGEAPTTQVDATPAIRVHPRRAGRRRRHSLLSRLLWIAALGACLVGALLVLVQFVSSS